MPERAPVPVLYIDPVAEMGGAEVVLRDIMARLDPDRYVPVLACLQPGPFVAEARALGVRAYGLPAHRTRQLHRVAWSCAWLTAIARRHRVGLVHANLGNALAYGWLPARARGAGLVWHVHDPHRAHDAFGRSFALVQRRMRPDWTIFATATVGRSYDETYPRLGRRSTVFGGVDPDVRGCGHRARRRLGIPADAPVVLSLGRLQRFKGQHVLLDVFPQVLRAHPDAHLVIGGGTLFGLEPGYADELARRAGADDVAGRVHLTGFVTDADKHDLLDACAVFAHPAASEPLGIAVLEAMAHGRPVVAFDTAGPAHTVDAGTTGLLVANGDRDALAAALVELLDDPARASAMGAAGRRRAEAEFSVQATADRVQAVYDQVLEPR